MDIFKGKTKEELTDIFETIDLYEWHDSLWKNPDFFDELKNYTREGSPKNSKHKEIKPYMEALLAMKSEGVF